MDIINIQEFLQSVTPVDGHNYMHYLEYEFKEVLFNTDFLTSMNFHFNDEETVKAGFRSHCSVDDFVRFDGKGLSSKEKFIELISDWFKKRNQAEELTEMVLSLFECPNQVEFLFINPNYQHYIFQATYIFKQGNQMYSLEFGGED